MTTQDIDKALADLRVAQSRLAERFRRNTQAPIKYTAEITTQGTTSAFSVVTVRADRKNGGPNQIRVRACNNGVLANSTNAVVAPTLGSATLETHTSNKDLTISEVLAVAATQVLTLTGVVVDAELVRLGGRIYEADARSASHVATGNVRWNIFAHTTQATRVLTLDTQPTSGDTMTIGSKVFTFVPVGTATANGEVSIGADLAAAKLALVAAINGTDSINTAHTQVTAGTFATHALTLTAIVGGTAANAIATTETFTASSNVFAGATLTGGADCTAANAILALVTAVTGDSSATVTAADGTGDTVNVTAKGAGTAGNALISTETLANGSFAAGTLTGGLNAEPGVFRFRVTNGTAETITIRHGQALIGGQPADHSDALQLTHAA
jgi:hypothetical protein